MNDPGIALTVEHIGKSFGDLVAVADASLTLAPGTVTCLLGPSGCGKTTLLRIIAGLERADTGAIGAGGRVLADGSRHVPPQDRGIGLVFQDYALFPHLDVAGNIAFGLRGMAADARAARVDALLARFQIAHLRGAFPHSLSGGEQQRVAIARALAREPAIVLMDEPFSGIDGALKHDIQTSVLSALRASGAAVLIVTHDPHDAMRNGDLLILMNKGGILQEGSPECCYDHPASLVAGRMLGAINGIPGTVRDGRLHSALGSHPASGLPDGPALLLARPEAVTLVRNAAAAASRGAIVSKTYLGGRYEVAVVIEGVTLLAHCTPAFLSDARDSSYAVQVDGGTIVSA